MKKIRAAIVGYGNIGKYVLEALEAAPDFEVAGVVRRNPNDVPDELKAYTVTDSITKLDKVDVAVLATPTRSVETYAKEILSLGINTVDSFDIHGGIVDLRRSLDAVAKAHNTVAVISAGWDPGSDSVVRALLEAMVPKGITYTNFGPGMSIHGTEVGGVENVTFLDIGDAGFFDIFRCVKIRTTKFKVNHGLTGTLHCKRFFVYFSDSGRSELVHSFCK